MQGGKVLADEVDIQEHYREWLANVGYIPQMIFLLDADIRKNVAFGIPEEEIDEEKLWHALKESTDNRKVRYGIQGGKRKDRERALSGFGIVGKVVRWDEA